MLAVKSLESQTALANPNVIKAAAKNEGSDEMDASGSSSSFHSSRIQRVARKHPCTSLSSSSSSSSSSAAARGVRGSDLCEEIFPYANASSLAGDISEFDFVDEDNEEALVKKLLQKSLPQVLDSSKVREAVKEEASRADRERQAEFDAV